MILASQKIIDAVDSAFWTITIVSVVFLIGIMAALVMFSVKYHRTRHPKPARISGNMKLEIAWTIIPTLIAVWMFFIGLDGFQLIRNVPENAYVVEVEARQWAFTFRYPEAKNVTDTKLYVPVGTPIHCKLSSAEGDVLHSLYLPHFRVKEDCVPGKPSYLWFQADEIGTYNIFCAEFCGKDHSQMLTTLEVLSQEDFDAWLDKKLEHRFRPIDDVAVVMKAESLSACDAPKLYKTYCASCHGGQGEGGLVEGARSFQTDRPAKWKKGVKITDIFRTLTLGLPDTRMKSFANLSAWDRFALAHYVASLYVEGPGRSAATQAEYEQLIKEYKLDEQMKVSREFPINEAIDEIVAKSANK